jgi:hypothetical protein
VQVEACHIEILADWFQVARKAAAMEVKAMTTVGQAVAFIKASMQSTE